METLRRTLQLHSGRKNVIPPKNYGEKWHSARALTRDFCAGIRLLTVAPGWPSLPTRAPYTTHPPNL
jgi:hypothetical protein